MMDTQSHVDHLITARKLVVGITQWQPGPYQGQQRWSGALQINGEGSDLKLVIDAYPAEPVLSYTICLNFGRCVSRLDGSSIDRHRNNGALNNYIPPSITLGWIIGPHCHLWRDNRHLVTNNELPEELEFAILLPANVQGFENSFRWFCGEVNIVCADGETFPALPRRERLI